MGAVLAKFRKEKTTTAVLEGLEEEIQQLERYTLNTQEQKKRFVGNFLASSIGIYAIAFLIFYFVYFPPTARERIIYSVPLLLFPLVIILLRRVFTWYFQRKLNKNSNKLSALRAQKKKILEQVMDKETYKVAVSLLARFADKNNGQKSLYAMTPRVPSSNSPSGPAPRVSMTQSTHSLRSNMSNTSLGATPGGAMPRPLMGDRNTQAMLPRTLALTPQRHQGEQGLRLRTPFPIVSQQGKGVLERIVDVLIGDGPQDRFAMICKECYTHNGMALKEDFDYMTFRCAFCNALNPSRKARPIAPRLPEQQISAIAGNYSSDSNTSSTDIDSDDDKGSRERPQVPPTPRRKVLTDSEQSTKTNVPEKSEVVVEGNVGAESADIDINTDAEPNIVLTAPAVQEDDDVLQSREEAAKDSDEMSRLQERFNRIYATPDDDTAEEDGAMLKERLSNDSGDEESKKMK